MGQWPRLDSGSVSYTHKETQLRNPLPTIHTLTGSHYCIISYNQIYPHPILYPQPTQQHSLSSPNTILCHTSTYICINTPSQLDTPGHPTPTWPESHQFFSSLSTLISPLPDPMLPKQSIRPPQPICTTPPSPIRTTSPPPICTTLPCCSICATVPHCSICTTSPRSVLVSPWSVPLRVFM